MILLAWRMKIVVVTLKYYDADHIVETLRLPPWRRVTLHWMQPRCHIQGDVLRIVCHQRRDVKSIVWRGFSAWLGAGTRYQSWRLSCCCCWPSRHDSVIPTQMSPSRPVDVCVPWYLPSVSKVDSLVFNEGKRTLPAADELFCFQFQQSQSLVVTPTLLSDRISSHMVSARSLPFTSCKPIQTMLCLIVCQWMWPTIDHEPRSRQVSVYRFEGSL